jgi:hypothetical protein
MYSICRFVTGDNRWDCFWFCHATSRDRVFIVHINRPLHSMQQQLPI